MKGGDGADPVREVAGVSAAGVLRRCAAVRGGWRPNELTTGDGRPLGRATWRLVDFADGSDAEFVRAVHRVWLDRTPDEPELERRVAQLVHGTSRLGLLVRVAVSTEGREARERPVSGAGMSALTAISTAAGRLASHRSLRRLLRRARRPLRPPHGPDGRARTTPNGAGPAS